RGDAREVHAHQMLGTEDAGPVCSLDVSDSGLTQLKLRGVVGATDSGQSDRRREGRRREDEPVGAQVAVHGFTLLLTKLELAGVSNFNPVFAARRYASRPLLSSSAQLSSQLSSAQLS